MAETTRQPVSERGKSGSQSQSDWNRPERETGFGSPGSKDTSKPSLGEQMKEQASSISEAATNLAEGAKEKVQNVLQQGAGKAEETREAAGEQLHTVADKIRAGGEAVSAKADELGSYLQDHDFNAIGRDVTDIVRRYPVQALLIGIGIGLLIGRAGR